MSYIQDIVAKGDTNILIIAKVIQKNLAYSNYIMDTNICIRFKFKWSVYAKRGT